MAQQKVQSTITINNLTDITNVYLEYGLANASASVTNSYSFDGLGEVSWSTTYPTWNSGYQIWIRQVTIKEGIVTPEYGTPYLDRAVNQINNNYVNLDNRLKNFFYPGDSSYPGAFAVSKSTADGLDITDATTYGFNTRIGVSFISMGYNKIPLLEMGLLSNNFNGIKLYSPTLTGSTISGNRLDATLDSNGLKLLKGGIEAGMPNTNGYIYFSTEDYPLKDSQASPAISGLTINGYTPSKTGTDGRTIDDSAWRAIIGTRFGVDSQGNLYASNVNISGSITATSLTITNDAEVSGVVVPDDISDMATTTDVSNALYSVEIKATAIDYVANTATLTAIPFYQGSTNIPNDVTLVYTWYKDSVISNNIVGSNSNTLTITNTTAMGLNRIYFCVISTN